IVIGVGIATSRGLRRGIVVNIEEASDSIATSVERAERVSGYKVVSAFVGIAGNHITSLNNRGVVATAQGDRPISEEDVQRAVEAARLGNVPCNRATPPTIQPPFRLYRPDGRKEPTRICVVRP